VGSPAIYVPFLTTCSSSPEPPCCPLLTTNTQTAHAILACYPSCIAGRPCIAHCPLPIVCWHCRASSIVRCLPSCTCCCGPVQSSPLSLSPTVSMQTACSRLTVAAHLWRQHADCWLFANHHHNGAFAVPLPTSPAPPPHHLTPPGPGEKGDIDGR
jgi:hypothetical protein